MEKILLAEYKALAKEIDGILSDFANSGLTNTKAYQETYALGNDVAQIIADLEMR